MKQFTNKLIEESSPYLLQHAHNPVNWYPWGSEALDLAKRENKPVLVSIGYSACHWCHVMERESFEDPETAGIMNENFVNIKVDREERPDVDHIYMDAVQAMTGSGGWPLNVFLTPELKPFYGGTYFPPRRAFNRASWREVLLAVSKAFREKRDEIDAQADNLTMHLEQSNSFGINTNESSDNFSGDTTTEIFNNIMNSADKQWGGFGRAPKFPQTFVIQYLLRYHDSTKSNEALRQALLSIDKMIDGGIYDQVGGGFARYATDSEWLVPHFEKMLYDNAHLISVISEAYQVTKNKRYREVMDETISFLTREMLHPRGGFFCAIDADSEGVEGKFYTWSHEEVSNILGDDAILFCEFFDISPEGNWEGRNIPWRKIAPEIFCKQKNISEEELEKSIQRSKRKLLEQRNKRTRPGTDDKILLGWNSLINNSFCKAYASTGTISYLQLAERNMNFMLDKFKKKDSDEYFHSWKNDQAKQTAFLDDYAFLVQSLICLQEVNGDVKYLLTARKIVGFVIENFSDKESIFFYFTPRNQGDILVRKKEIYDGATASGNSVMAQNLYKLSIYFDIPAWKERSLKMLNSIGMAVSNYPVSFSVWAMLLAEFTYGTKEIAIVKEDFENDLRALLKEYIPNKVLMCGLEQGNQFPLLSGKKGQGGDFYLCRNFTCEKPVSTIADLIKLIRAK